MESDSSLPAIVLAISLIWFGLAVLAETCISFLRTERAQQLAAQGVAGAAALHGLYSMPMGPTGALSLVRTLTFSAALLSGVAMVVPEAGVQWQLIALISLAVIAYTRIVHSIARALASAFAERIALKVAPSVRALSWLLTPVLAVQAVLARRTLGVAARQAGSTPEALVQQAELPLDVNGEPLNEREMRMIRAVLQLDNTTAREIMVPRVDMVAADVNTTVGELAELMVTSGHSRIPLYSGDLDHIEGMAHARDILSHLVQRGDAAAMSVEGIVRPAFFIPEAKSLEELLNDFQRERTQMAIVIDEYGGVSGLVTIEDLLEEVVGDIQDEFDTGEPEIEPISETEYLMDARVSIDELHELLKVQVEANGFDTVGGFVYSRLGKIPSPGDTVVYDGITIEVMSTVGRRLKKLRVTKSKPAEAKAEAGQASQVK